MTQNLPAHLQAYQTPDIAGTLSANLGSAMPPHVSIGGGRFTLIDAGNNEIPVPTFDPAIGVYLDACIIDVNPVMSRIYFAGQYDPNSEGVRPDCFSDNGVGPSVSANSPQAPTCAICPRAEWTKVNANGKKVPWCSQKQKVALLIPGFQTLFLLAVPPNSHGPLREYVEKCKGNGVNIANLITRISFVPNVQGTLQFHPVTYIDEPTAQLRQAAYAEKKTDALVGRNDVARPAGQIAAPQAQTIIPNQISGSGDFNQPMPAPGVAQINGPFASGMPAPVAVPQPMIQTSPQGSPQWPNPSGTSMIPNIAAQGGTVPTVSPSEGTPTGRRRRRTAAEMAQANGQTPADQASRQPATTPQVPFPVPGQQTTTGGTGPQQATVQPAQFGIAQGQAATANPELAGMLDDFFAKG